MTTTKRNPLRFALLLAAALLALPAAAGIEEDWIEGEKAYQRGDVARAITYLRKAADAGHGRAQARLASIMDASDFNEEAVAYYRKSADQGEPEGLYGLAGMYAVGEGVTRDSQEAFKLFVRAADAGHEHAARLVADGYLYGQFGLTEEQRNSEAAAQAIRRMAERDYVPAVEALAKAYRSGGFGIGPDAKEAEIWEEKLNKLRPRPKRR
jgi:hypothetical protein